jgi:hypothetical protein
MISDQTLCVEIFTLVGRQDPHFQIPSSHGEQPSCSISVIWTPESYVIPGFQSSGRTFRAQIHFPSNPAVITNLNWSAPDGTLSESHTAPWFRLMKPQFEEPTYENLAKPSKSQHKFKNCIGTCKHGLKMPSKWYVIQIYLFLFFK